MASANLIPPTQVEKAASFLRTYLKDGARPVKEILEQAATQKITVASIKRAREKMMVFIRKGSPMEGGKSYWSLAPEKPHESTEEFLRKLPRV